MAPQATASLADLFPLANYGFASSVAHGSFEFDRGFLAINNRIANPVASFDCSSSTRFIVEVLRESGVDADACLLELPTKKDFCSDLTVTDHIVTLVKHDGDADDVVIGFTPYDKLLGIYPCAEVTAGSSLFKLLQAYGRPDEGDEILEHSLNLAHVLVPIQRRTIRGGAWLPLSSCKRRGLFGIAGLNLSLTETGASFLYSVEFLEGGRNESFPLVVRAQREIKVEMTSADFDSLCHAVIDGNLDFYAFCDWLQSNQDKLTDFGDVTHSPPMSPLLKRAIGNMMVTNWETVATFLKKLSIAMNG